MEQSRKAAEDALYRDEAGGGSVCRGSVGATSFGSWASRWFPLQRAPQSIVRKRAPFLDITFWKTTNEVSLLVVG